MRILIVRTSAMGDVVHTLPAVAILRDAFPQAQIGWVIEERWRELLCASGEPLAGPRSAARPLVDAVHLVNLKAWRRKLLHPATWSAFRASVRALRESRYDVAVDLQGALRSATLARLSGATRIYGFAEPRERPAQKFYTNRIALQGAHVAEQNCAVALAVVRDFGAVSENSAGGAMKFRLPVDAQDEAWATRTLAEKPWLLPEGGRFAVITPGAGWGAKQWPAERYGELAQRLAELGIRCLVNFGPGEEALAEQVERASDGAARRCLYSLDKLMAITRRAALFVGGDTGPLHLAAALGTPVVALFGPTDPARNGPLGSRSVVLRSPLSVTSHKRRAEADPGLLSISVDEVFWAAQSLLQG